MLNDVMLFSYLNSVKKVHNHSGFNSVSPCSCAIYLVSNIILLRSCESLHLKLMESLSYHIPTLTNHTPGRHYISENTISCVHSGICVEIGACVSSDNSKSYEWDYAAYKWVYSSVLRFLYNYRKLISQFSPSLSCSWV